MKNLMLLAVGITVGLSSVASARSLKVRVVPSVPGDVALHFSTIERHSSMCHMSNTKLELQRPPALFGPETVIAEGAITIEAQVLPRTMCLTAFGPHSGGLTLHRGFDLPALTNGKYLLSINGESYGTLVVQANEVKIID